MILRVLDSLVTIFIFLSERTNYLTDDQVIIFLLLNDCNTFLKLD